MSTMTAVTPKEQFLNAFDQEFETTMRVLRNYPADKLDLQPHPKCKTARDLAWLFALERGLGMMVMSRQFTPAAFETPPPPAPESWDDLLAGIEKMNSDYRALISGMSDEQLMEPVTFVTGPKQVGDMPGLTFLWFMLCDQIHHRGQFSIYLRMADGKVPSIYGPSADEPWG